MVSRFHPSLRHRRHTNNGRQWNNGHNNHPNHSLTFHSIVAQSFPHLPKVTMSGAAGGGDQRRLSGQKKDSLPRNGVPLIEVNVPSPPNSCRRGGGGNQADDQEGQRRIEREEEQLMTPIIRPMTGQPLIQETALS